MNSPAARVIAGMTGLAPGRSGLLLLRRVRRLGLPPERAESLDLHPLHLPVGAERERDHELAAGDAGPCRHEAVVVPVLERRIDRVAVDQPQLAAVRLDADVAIQTVGIHGGVLL